MCAVSGVEHSRGPDPRPATKSEIESVATSSPIPNSSVIPYFAPGAYVSDAILEQHVTHAQDPAITAVIALQLGQCVLAHKNCALVRDTCHFFHVGVLSGSSGSSVPFHLTVHRSSSSFC